MRGNGFQYFAEALLYNPMSMTLSTSSELRLEMAKLGLRHMSGMEIVGIYTDTVEFIGNASPSGPSPEIS